MVLGGYRQLQACQVNVEWEKIVSQIEETARVLEESGACAEWLGNADPKIAKVSLHFLLASPRFLLVLPCQVSATINGPLLETLAKVSMPLVSMCLT